MDMSARVNQVSGIVIDAAMHIHRELGPGLLESVYLHILAHELRKRGLRVEVEVPVPVAWDSMQLEVGFRADLIVDGLVVVELKSVEAIAPVHKKQVLTYLRLTGLQVGLLINFGAALLKDGITRIVNNLGEQSRPLEGGAGSPTAIPSASPRLRERPLPGLTSP